MQNEHRINSLIKLIDERRRREDDGDMLNYLVDKDVTLLRLICGIFMTVSWIDYFIYSNIIPWLDNDDEGVGEIMPD